MPDQATWSMPARRLRARPTPKTCVPSACKPTVPKGVPGACHQHACRRAKWRAEERAISTRANRAEKRAAERAIGTRFDRAERRATERAIDRANPANIDVVSSS